MKIKQHLVIFLTLLLMSIQCNTVQKVTEQSLLVKSYLMNRAMTTSAEAASASQVRKHFKMNMVVVREINKPAKSVVKDYTVNGFMGPQFISLTSIKPKPGKRQKIFWTK
jgi:hypothetical protein